MKIFNFIPAVIIGLTIWSCAKESTFTSDRGKAQSSNDLNPEQKGIGVDIPDVFDTQSGVLKFQARQIVEASYDLIFDRLESSTDFELELVYSDRTDMHKQKSRNLVTQLATQGTDGTQKMDLFDQKKDRGAVDILLVVDNSRSMAEEHQNLSTKLAALLSKIEDTRWNIAITSTDAGDACDIDVISYNQPNAVDVFKNQITKLGTNGDGNEQGIYRAVNGLKCNNGNWLRDDAVLAVLIVSDEDNCSRDGSGCRGKAWNDITYLTNYIEGDLSRAVGKNTGFYGIFWHPDQSCQTGENRGYQYAELINYKADAYNVAAETRWGSICSEDYTSTLESISRGISYQLDTSWELSSLPEMGSLEVSLMLKDGSEQKVAKSAYNLTGKIITFLPNMAPPLGSQIKANYITGKTPKFSSLELKKRPADDTMSIYVNQMPLDEGQYTIVDNRIEFVEIPEDNANIKLSYKEDTPLDLSFAVDGNPKESSAIMVYVDNRQVENFTYDKDAKAIVFQSAPEDGAAVDINYKNIDGPKLTYSVPLVGENPKNFALFYGEDPIAFTVSESKDIVIEASDHEDGRVLTLAYDVDNDIAKKISLPKTPIAGTVSIDSNSSICNRIEDYVVEGATITSQCTVTEKVEASIRYEYLDTRTTFKLSSDIDLSAQQFEVFIDGIKTSQFALNGDTLTLTKMPKLGASIEVHYGASK